MAILNHIKTAFFLALLSAIVLALGFLIGGKTGLTIVYESYGPGGSALIIEALTENRNRAAQEIKHILSKNGFELATPGSATWAFEKQISGNEWLPKNTVPINEEDGAKLQTLIEELE